MQYKDKKSLSGWIGSIIIYFFTNLESETLPTDGYCDNLRYKKCLFTNNFANRLNATSDYLIIPSGIYFFKMLKGIGW